VLLQKAERKQQNRPKKKEKSLSFSTTLLV